MGMFFLSAPLHNAWYAKMASYYNDIGINLFSNAFNAPYRLKQLFVRNTSKDLLRCSDQHIFIVPIVFKEISWKAFKFRTPSHWNHAPAIFVLI